MDATQLLKGALPAVTLAVIEEGDSYGYEVVSRLRAGGLTSVGDASVYGTLQRLYGDGAVSAYVAPSSTGPSRKYYAITAKGRADLKIFRDQWSEFQHAIAGLLGSDPMREG